MKRSEEIKREHVPSRFHQLQAEGELHAAALRKRFPKRSIEEIGIVLRHAAFALEQIAEAERKYARYGDRRKRKK